MHVRRSPSAPRMTSVPKPECSVIAPAAPLDSSTDVDWITIQSEIRGGKAL